MPVEAGLARASFEYLLLLIKVSCALVMVPVPFAATGPGLARLALASVVSVILWPRQHALAVPDMPLIDLVLNTGYQLPLAWGVGVAASLLGEAFAMGAQLIATQAGFGYASTIDPQTQADGGLLPTLARLLAGMLGLALGLDHLLLQAIAAIIGLQGTPGPETRAIWAGLLPLVSHGTEMAGRFALPVVAMLLLVDLTLAWLSRINEQIGMLSLSMPLKLALGLFLLILSIAGIWPLSVALVSGTRAFLHQFTQLVTSRHV